MTIGLGHYLAVGAILFTLGILGIFLNRKNIIVILMSIELILLAVNINLVAFSTFLGDIVGQVLYTQYFYVFQVAGLVLLVAMIGAIVLTLRHKAKVKRQDINVQNARTPELAMAVRQVASGQGLQDSDAAEWVK